MHKHSHIHMLEGPEHREHFMQSSLPSERRQRSDIRQEAIQEGTSYPDELRQ